MPVVKIPNNFVSIRPDDSFQARSLITDKIAREAAIQSVNDLAFVFDFFMSKLKPMGLSLRRNRLRTWQQNGKEYARLPAMRADRLYANPERLVRAIASAMIDGAFIGLQDHTRWDISLEGMSKALRKQRLPQDSLRKVKAAGPRRVNLRKGSDR